MDGVVSLFTTAQLTRILEIPQPEIRRWVRAGLLQPAETQNRLAFFDFRDVAMARALQVLTGAVVTPRRIKWSLALSGRVDAGCP